MFAKSTRIGLVSLFVVLATALGGCAESVGSEPASAPLMSRPALELSRFTPRTLDPEETSTMQVAKVEPLETHSETKRQLRTAAEVH